MQWTWRGDQRVRDPGLRTSLTHPPSDHQQRPNAPGTCAAASPLVVRRCHRPPSSMRHVAGLGSMRHVAERPSAAAGRPTLAPPHHRLWCVAVIAPRVPKATQQLRTQICSVLGSSMDTGFTKKRIALDPRSWLETRFRN